MGKDKVAAGVKGKSPKAGMVDPKGAWTKVQERTLAKNGMRMKKAQKGAIISESGDLADALNETMRMRKAGTVPKTDKAAGRYMDDLNKRGKLGTAKPKHMAKPKAKSGGSFPDLNKDGKITKADILKGRGVIAKMGKSMKKCKYGCK
jgi:hypothetical protein